MTIHTIKTVVERNNESVVSAIERLLERAKAGEIISFVAVSQLKGGEWFEQSTNSDDLFRQLGMAEMVCNAIRERISGR